MGDREVIDGDVGLYREGRDGSVLPITEGGDIILLGDGEVIDGGVGLYRGLGNIAGGLRGVEGKLVLGGGGLEGTAVRTVLLVLFERECETGESFEVIELGKVFNIGSVLEGESGLEEES